MRKGIITLCLILVCVSGADAYVFNFQPGPFPYPYPNTLDDFPNTAYCNYQPPIQPAPQYPSYKVDGVVVPYIQPDGRVIYFWSYNKTTSLGVGIQKVKPVSIPKPTLREVTYDSSYTAPVVPARRYGWGRPF